MLCKLLTDTAAQYPNNEALVYGEYRLTWSELLDQVLLLAGGLKNEGVKEGDLVALWLNVTPCFIVSYYAVLARGAVVVPLNPAMKSGDFSLLNCYPKVVISSQSLQSSCIRAMQLENVNPEAKLLISPDEANCLDWWLLKGEPVTAKYISGDATALVQFSSGSTGKPKMLSRTHRQCVSEFTQSSVTLKTNVNDSILCVLPLFHAHGMGNALWASVGTGAKLVLVERPEPIPLQRKKILRLLETERITILPGVPFLFSALADSTGNSDLTSIRLCFSAGTSLSRDVFDRFIEKFGVPIRQLYGCTEAGALSINLDEMQESSVLSVGKAMNGVEICICDENGNRVARNKVGEIRVKSGGLMAGYIENEELNQSSFYQGWFISGDVGRFNSADQLEIIGRKAFVINVAGQKVYANEIEEVLLKHPKILKASVKALLNEVAGEMIVVYVVTQKEMSKYEVIRFCRTYLPDYKCPREVSFVVQLPDNALGGLKYN